MDKTIDFDLVADIYDYYVNTDLDIPFFLKETENIEGDILELMCGTGRVSIPLLQAGRELTCVDYCKDMLFRFKEKLMDERLYAEIFQQDIYSLNLNLKFNMSFIPFHSFSELADKNKQQTALQNINKHLHTDGKFICTLQNPNIRTKGADGNQPGGHFRSLFGGSVQVDGDGGGPGHRGGYLLAVADRRGCLAADDPPQGHPGHRAGLHD